MSDELREALRETLRESKAEDGGGSAGVGATASVVAEPVEAADDDAAGAGEVGETAGGAGADGSAPGGTDGRARGTDGKFVPKPKEEAKSETKAPTPGAKALVKPAPVAAKVGTVAPIPGDAAVTQAPKFKPPPNVKLSLREKWPTIPEDVQEEFDRVNREAQLGMQKNAGAAKFHEAFQQMATPYMPLLGADPIKATQGIYQTLYALQTGPAPNKAKIAANIIKSYGIDIDMLAAELDGKPAPAGPQAIDPEHLIQQAMSRMEERQKSEAAQRNNAEMARLASEFATDREFFDSETETGKRIRAKVGALLGTKPHGGDIAKALEAAYNDAIWADAETREVLLQRERAQRVNAEQASTQRAKAASSSVKSNPAAEAPRPAAGNLREALRETMEEMRRGK